MEESKYYSKYATGGHTGSGWNMVNSVGWVAALASALGIGIPALVKSNDAENEARHGNGYGRGHGECSENTLVSRYEMQQAQEIAQLKADKATDAKLLDLYKQTVAENKAIRSEIADVVAKNSEAHTTIFNELVAQREKQLASNAEFDKEIALNKQHDYYQNELNECRFVRAKKVVDKDQICPEVMARYNSWVAPTSGSTPASSSN